MRDLIVKNPSNGTTIVTIPMTPSEAISKHIESCRIAQKKWAKRPLKDRIAILQNFRVLLADQVDDSALIQCRETGKPITQARGEILASLERVDFFVDHVMQTLASETVFDCSPWQERISYEPLGVIANISAWNYPYFVGLNVLIPALLAGNGICYKPSEFSTMTGLKIVELFNKAGLPKDLLIAIIGDSEQGKTLCASDIDGMYFTGSEPTGRAIYSSVQEHMIPVGLELGGKDPTYVTDDCDLEATAAAVGDGVFYNAGQSCCAVERIYVHSSVYESFIDSFAQWVAGIKTGDPEQEGTYLGPLTRGQQIEVLTKQFDDACDKGARVVVAGGRRGDNSQVFDPVVLADVNHTMDVMCAESFGPIIGIQKVSDDTEAVRLMNDSCYGLTAGIYCRNRQRSLDLLEQLEAGSVYWNACDRVSPRLPWTGWKNSGLGSTLSHIGIKTFTRPKGWHLREV